MNQSKVNKRKQMQGNANSVASITLTIELNVKRPAEACLKCGKQGHFAVKCQEKTRVSSGPANKVHHTTGAPGYAEGGESASESVSDSDESLFVRKGVNNKDCCCCCWSC